MNKTITIKKYSFFLNVADVKEAKGFVQFDIQDWPNRILLWAEKLFNLIQGNFEVSSNLIKLCFIDVKDGSSLVI